MIHRRIIFQKKLHSSFRLYTPISISTGSLYLNQQKAETENLIEKNIVSLKKKQTYKPLFVIYIAMKGSLGIGGFHHPLLYGLILHFKKVGSRKNQINLVLTDHIKDKL